MSLCFSCDIYVCVYVSKHALDYMCLPIYPLNCTRTHTHTLTLSPSHGLITLIIANRLGLHSLVQHSQQSGHSARGNGPLYKITLPNSSVL